MIRVGLAGYSAARTFHVPLIVAAGGTVAAVATRDPARRELAATDFPGVAVVDDLAALLEVPDLDLVVIATPTRDHLAHTLAAIAAGIDCVVEKPVGLTTVEVRAIDDSARLAGRLVVPFHNRRYEPSQLTARQLLSQERFGHVWRHEFRWERFRPNPPRRWRETAAASEGGGLLMDLGPHLVDSSIQLFGPVEQVSAEVAATLSVAHDDVFLALRHANGVTSHLYASTVAAVRGPRRRITGSLGGWVCDGLPDDGLAAMFSDVAVTEHHVGCFTAGEELTPVPRASGGPVDFYRETFAAIRGEAEPPVTMSAAIAVAEVLDAALAQETGPGAGTTS